MRVSLEIVNGAMDELQENRTFMMISGGKKVLSDVIADISLLQYRKMAVFLMITAGVKYNEAYETISCAPLEQKG